MVKAPSSNRNIMKFLCSYGGKIVPRHTDGLLRYSGGLTRFLAVDRSISYSELMVKLVEFCGSSVVLRCQLPDGDLETLVAVRSDEDLANIVEEYDRASSSGPVSIRAVLSPPMSPLKKVSSSSSIESDCSPRRFSHTAAASTCSAGCCSPQKPARRASPTQSFDSSGHRADAGVYVSRCYSPPVGFPVGLKSEAANLRYYPSGGKPRYSYRAAHWH